MDSLNGKSPCESISCPLDLPAQQVHHSLQCVCPGEPYIKSLSDTLFRICFTNSFHNGLFNVAFILSSGIAIIPCAFLLFKMFRTRLHLNYRLPSIDRPIIQSILCTAVVGLCLRIANDRLTSKFWSDIFGDCVDNTDIYHQMFCEPTDYTKLIRRKSNAWSNQAYLWVSLYSFFQLQRSDNPFRNFDLLFSLSAFVLSIVSFLWHSTNCWYIHYVDLTVMNFAILYSPIRSICATVKNLCLPQYQNVFTFAYGITCLCVVCLFYYRWRMETYHIEVPTGATYDVSPEELIFSFVLSPFYLCVISAIWIASSVRANINFWNMSMQILSVSIGWWFHLSEKWAADIWCFPNSWIQPTSIFHVLTAVALAGYVNLILEVENVGASNTKMMKED